MAARALLVILLAAAPLFGQLQLSVVDRWFERTVEGQYDLGAVPTGDALDTVFRLRNPGTATVTLTILEVRGAGFSKLSAPAVGTQIPAGGSVNFTVRFRPELPVSYSASLQADGVSVILRGSGVATLTVFLEQKSGRTALGTGATADFGSVERGAAASLQFRLENQTSQTLALTTLNVGGPFRLAAGPSPGTVFAPGDSAPFEVVFEPRQSGVLEGSLDVNQRHIVLAGTAVEPALPEAEISLQIDSPASAQQGRLSVKLASTSRTSGGGSVKMEFLADAGGNDPAAVFATGGRSAVFTIAEGDTTARFGSLPYAAFQTGTTAGRIVFTLQIGVKSSQATLVIPPAPPGLEKPTALRNGTELDVRLTGFDNTRTAGRISFTFLDRDGNVLGPGPIRVDQSEVFRRFFEASDLGGLFALRAVFPVSGPSGQIDAVEIEVANSAGSTKSERVRF